jgi:hypothetical protein
LLINVTAPQPDLSGALFSCLGRNQNARKKAGTEGGIAAQMKKNCILALLKKNIK